MQQRSGAIILAQAKGAMWEILFEPAVRWAADACLEAGIPAEGILAVCQPGEKEAVQQALPEGGRAVSQNLKQAMETMGNLYESVFILRGDAPFLQPEALREAEKEFIRQGDGLAILTAEDSGGASPWGIVLSLAAAGRLSFDGREGDPFMLAVDACRGASPCAGIACGDARCTLRASGRKQLLRLTEAARMEIIDQLLEQDVSFLSTDGVIIGRHVAIGPGTEIYPNTILRGNTVIGSGCTIGPSSLIEDSTIGDHTKADACEITQSVIGSRVSMGPWVHVRPDSRILDEVHLGNFVEVKNSVVGDRTSVSHLTYVGDSDVGKGVNFGCGCVTVNYDGLHKHRTVIGDHAFIGCNTNLVAPVKVGDGAFTAAGSTITKDVPSDALAIERGQQVIKDGWAAGKIKIK